MLILVVLECLSHQGIRTRLIHARLSVHDVTLNDPALNQDSVAPLIKHLGDGGVQAAFVEGLIKANPDEACFRLGLIPH